MLCSKPNYDERKRTRAVQRLQAALVHAQELGDEKVKMVQLTQDLIDNKQRSLDGDLKILSDYKNNHEEKEDDQSEDMKYSPISMQGEASTSSEGILPHEVELPPDDEISEDEGELSSDGVEPQCSEDSDDDLISDDEDESAKSEDADAGTSDDLYDIVSSTEKSEGTNLSDETFNFSDYTEPSDTSSE